MLVVHVALEMLVVHVALEMLVVHLALEMLVVHLAIQMLVVHVALKGALTVVLKMLVAHAKGCTPWGGVVGRVGGVADYGMTPLKHVDAQLVSSPAA